MDLSFGKLQRVPGDVRGIRAPLACDADDVRRVWTPVQPMEDPLVKLRDAYRELAIAADTAPNPRVQNKRFDELQKVHKKLRATAEGRLVIESLLADESVCVRGWSAAHCLMWNPQAARPVLEEIRDSDGFWAFEAKYTLIEFDAGRLHFDF